MKPRWYQEAAVSQTYKWLKEKEGNPCIVLPTGAGKSIVIAQMLVDVATHWGGRAMQLCHRKELIEQNADKVSKLHPGIRPGIYSAGLKRRDTSRDVTFAGIQSVYDKAHLFGKLDLLVIDEAHLIPADGESKKARGDEGGGEGMFRQFIADAQRITPHMRVVGLTATPYRLKSGMVCGPDNILNGISFEVGVQELINEGYLCPLTSPSAHVDQIDTKGIMKTAGDFNLGQLGVRCSEDGMVQDAVANILTHTQDRQSVLVFCTGKEHGRKVRDELVSHNTGHGVAYLDGDTPNDERDSIIASFRRGTIKYLVNIDVLTTGFDATCIDCVAILRPTMSPGLFYQMVGRGLRIDEGKSDCLVLDFGGNITRHGPVDRISVSPKEGYGQKAKAEPAEGEAKAIQCPHCFAFCLPEDTICLKCFEELPKRGGRSSEHDTEASQESVLSKPVEPEWFDVTEVFYSLHTKKSDSTSQTMRVDYQCGISHSFSEWVCIEHDGFARRKAEAWWRDRSDAPCPDTLREAIRAGQRGELAEPTSIMVDTSGQYARIVEAELSPPDDQEIAERQARDDESQGFVGEALNLFEGAIDEDDIPF